MEELESMLKQGCTAADLMNLRRKVWRRKSETREVDLIAINEALENLTKIESETEEKIKKDRIQKVSKLIKELMGERTVRKTAEDSRVAPSYLLGIKEGKHLPSAETLRKLTEPSAHPQNGITFEDLMIAAGYQNDYSEQRDDYREQNDVDNYLVKKSGNNIEVQTDKDLSNESFRERRNLRNQEISKYVTMASGILYKSLAEKGMAFLNNIEAVGIRGYRPDMAVSFNQGSIGEWWFEIKFLGEERGLYGNRGYVNIRHILGQFMFVEPKKDRKISLVINNKNDFELIMGYKEKLAYRGELSVILVDVDSFQVVDEVYLSHYEIGDDSLEIKLI